MHVLNVAFAAYIVAVTLIPFLLTAFTGVSLYSSKTSVPGLTIERGELMITHATPVARLIPGDIILLRDKNSWNLQVRQLVSTAANGRLTSVFTNSGVDGTVSDVTTIEGTANVHKVTSSIPVFGLFHNLLWFNLGKVASSGAHSLYEPSSSAFASTSTSYR
ncbi:MAG: hypothetical protein WDO06_06705 [Actinomycetota bacterium]